MNPFSGLSATLPAAPSMKPVVASYKKNIICCCLMIVGLVLIVYLPLEVAPSEFRDEKNIDRMRAGLKIKNRSKRLDLQERRRRVRQTSSIKMSRPSAISDRRDAKTDISVLMQMPVTESSAAGGHNAGCWVLCGMQGPA